jgi:hypothetical protein
MSWTYEQATGRLLDADGKLAMIGYAGGNCGDNPEGKNNPSMQDAKSIGPLPQGKYTFGEPVAQSHLGPYAIPLIPDPANEMYGRGDFYFHGDSIQDPGCASEGCIIGPRAVREEVWNSNDHDLIVVSGA